MNNTPGITRASMAVTLALAATTIIAHAPASRKRRERFVLPDPPEGEPEDMTSFDHLTLSGSAHHLAQHLGSPETTLVTGERYLTRAPGAPASERMAPDPLIAFNVEPETYRENNGYIISEEGKPPDFVPEIASRSTGQHEVVDQRPAYAGLGIPEYWRFDETGEFHGTRLAGDRLVDGRHEPVPIETVGDGVPQGYSSVLNLIIRWDHGHLGWHDPETGDHIATFAQEGARAESAEARAEIAEEQTDIDREARMASEARVRELRRSWSGTGRADFSRPGHSTGSCGDAVTAGHPEPAS